MLRVFERGLLSQSMKEDSRSDCWQEDRWIFFQMFSRWSHSFFIKSQELPSRGRFLLIRWSSPCFIPFCSKIEVEKKIKFLYDFDKTDYKKNKWTFLKQEIDGVRIITKIENKIMRQIPKAYINIFEAFSEHSLKGDPSSRATKKYQIIFQIVIF